MKTTYYAEHDINLPGGKTITKGTAIATVETPDDLPVDRAINAIGKGLATANAPAPTSADATQPQAPVAGAAPKGRGK